MYLGYSILLQLLDARFPKIDSPVLVRLIVRGEPLQSVSAPLVRSTTITMFVDFFP